MSISDEERRTFTEFDARALSAAGEVADSPAEARAWIRLVGAMGRVLYPFECAGSAGSQSCPPRDWGVVETTIELRVRTREIRMAVLGHGEAVRRAFRALDAPADGAWQRRTEVLIALSLAAGQARFLGNRLTFLPSSVSLRQTALAQALGTALADSGRALDTAQGLLREMSGADGEVRAVISGTAACAAVTRAVRLAACLEEDVRAQAVDASGVDLSRLGPVDPGLLASVIWSRTTVWPACIAPLLRARSNRVADGVYQVRRVYDTRDG
ncbi:hypothetical protein [Embleya sp. NPDC005971]|uniref:hypothetical protein n=1 Tax=Embleya sp. NPDC005971 TaxID=3156724 RepID=UPI00340D437D